MKKKRVMFDFVSIVILSASNLLLLASTIILQASTAIILVSIILVLPEREHLKSERGR